jgi:hypothetical protein
MSLFRRLLGVPGGDDGDDDATLIDRLRAGGVDLSRPIAVEHYLTLPNERMARQFVAKLGTSGAIVDLSPSLFRGHWTVRVTLSMVVTLERMEAMRQSLGAFAEEHGGSYDGWGTSGRAV